jgi:undecaprenyl-phosphate 4-deoxy-4-formamido-L-arabinose transferase
MTPPGWIATGLERTTLPAGISVVVPVFNAEATLSDLLDRLHAALTSHGSPYEIILVDDGSRDGSWRIISQAADSRRVRGIALMRNAGQHNALLCGVRLARYDTTVTLDDDLQHAPEDVPRLAARLQQGDVDLVYGVPGSRRHPLHRRCGAWLLRQALAVALGRRMARCVNSFRAFRSDLRRAFDAFTGPAVVLDVLLSWATDRVAAVEVTHHERGAGRSTYSLAQLVPAALLVVTAFSTAPLRVASLLGLLLTLFGAGILAYVLLTYFTEGSLPGFPFLASLTAIFGGAQLFSLGVLGEYVAQVFQRSMHRPTYAVRTITERHTAKAQTEFPDGPDSRAEQSPYGVYHGSHDDAG